MKIFVVIEMHFIEYQGSIYTDIAFAYPYWKEYLQIFDEVCAVARVKKINTLPDGLQRADGEKVEFMKIRDYLGFWESAGYSDSADIPDYTVPAVVPNPSMGSETPDPDFIETLPPSISQMEMTVPEFGSISLIVLILIGLLIGGYKRYL